MRRFLFFHETVKTGGRVELQKLFSQACSISRQPGEDPLREVSRHPNYSPGLAQAYYQVVVGTWASVTKETFAKEGKRMLVSESQTRLNISCNLILLIYSKFSPCH